MKIKKSVLHALLAVALLSQTASASVLDRLEQLVFQLKFPAVVSKVCAAILGGESEMEASIKNGQGKVLTQKIYSHQIQNLRNVLHNTLIGEEFTAEVIDKMFREGDQIVAFGGNIFVYSEERGLFKIARKLERFMQAAGLIGYFDLMEARSTGIPENFFASHPSLKAYVAFLSADRSWWSKGSGMLIYKAILVGRLPGKEARDTGDYELTLEFRHNGKIEAKFREVQDGFFKQSTDMLTEMFVNELRFKGLRQLVNTLTLKNSILLDGDADLVEILAAWNDRQRQLSTFDRQIKPYVRPYIAVGDDGVQ